MQGSEPRRKDKHAEGPLATKGPRYTKPRDKNTKARLRRWDKRSSKNRDTGD